MMKVAVVAWMLAVCGAVTAQGGWKVQKTTGTEASVGADGLVTIRRTDLAAEKVYGLVTSKPVAVAPCFAYEFGMTCRGTSLLRPDSSFQHGAYACLDLFPLDARHQLVTSDRTQGKSRLSTYSSSPDFRTYEGVFRMPRTDGELSAQLRLQLSDRRRGNPSVAEFSDAWIRPVDFALSNPGFEDGVDAPEDWTAFGAAKCARTDAEHHGGRFAVMVADAPDGELSGWSRLVPVRADRTYSLSGWVKGGDLNPDGHVAGGALAVSFLDAERNTVGETSVSTAVPARTDWTRVELKEISPPRGAVLMRITAGLRYCRGQAWFDDLDLAMCEVRTEKVAEVVRDPKPSPSVRYATNLLANGDCEAGADGKPAGWHYVGKAEKDWTEAEIAEFIGQGRPKYAIGRGRGFWSSDTAYEGAHALANVSIDPPLASGGWHGRNPVAGCWVSDPMPCVPGKAYVAGGWIRAGRLINDSWYGPLRLVFRDAKGRVLAPANRDIRAMMEACAPGVWSVWWTAPYVAPKGVATVELEFGQLKGRMKTWSVFGKRDTGFTREEETTHFGLWCILSSPLLMGCDVRTIDPESLKLATNPYLLSMNQNDLGVQAYPVRRDGDAVVFVKDCGERFGTARYVALYNGSDKDYEFSFAFSELELGGKVGVVDLVEAADIGEGEGLFVMKVAPHASKFYRMDAERRLTQAVYEAENAYLHDFQTVNPATEALTPHFISERKASGQAAVGLLGMRPGNDLVWKEVRVAADGLYDFEFACFNRAPGIRTFDVEVDGKKIATVEIPYQAWEPRKVRIEVPLTAGVHRVRLSNDSAPMPVIDCLRVRPRKTGMEVVYLFPAAKGLAALPVAFG